MKKAILVIILVTLTIGLSAHGLEDLKRAGADHIYPHLDYCPYVDIKFNTLNTKRLSGKILFYFGPLEFKYKFTSIYIHEDIQTIYFSYWGKVVFTYGYSPKVGELIRNEQKRLNDSRTKN
jgi:hypothetical protein